MNSSQPNGFILVDKPVGWTSFDVVAKVRGVIFRALATEELSKPKQRRRVKVGHCGTLDPAASGLLILAIGKATKSISKLIKAEKTYLVEVTLGSKSSTGDREGEITKTEETKNMPAERDVYKALEEFIGRQTQIPPVYSAKKISGTPAYKLARKGQKVEMKPQQIEIMDISNVSFRWPLISFSTTVSSGTYIRTLAEDLGSKLQCGAYLSSLRRTKITKFAVNDALNPETLSFTDINQALFTLEN